MSKIHSNMENPIDIYLLRICEKVAPTFKKFKFTPNEITVIGTIFGVIGCYFIWKNKPIIAILLLWISYFFDCLDGYYARRYNMCTKLGDYFDHIRDILLHILITSLLYMKLKTVQQRCVFISIVVVFIFLMTMHLGCQEKNSGNKDFNDSLKVTEVLCPNPDYIKYTRFFGCGTYNIVIIAFLIYYICNLQKK